MKEIPFPTYKKGGAQSTHANSAPDYTIRLEI